MNRPNKGAEASKHKKKKKPRPSYKSPMDMLESVRELNEYYKPKWVWGDDKIFANSTFTIGSSVIYQSDGLKMIIDTNSFPSITTNNPGGWTSAVGTIMPDGTFKATKI